MSMMHQCGTQWVVQFYDSNNNNRNNSIELTRSELNCFVSIIMILS